MKGPSLETKNLGRYNSSSNSSNASTVLLAVTWFGLCAYLVSTQFELIAIFYSFVLSFACHAFIRSIIILFRGGDDTHYNDNRGQIKCFVNSFMLSLSLMLLLIYKESSFNQKKFIDNDDDDGSFITHQLLLKILPTYNNNSNINHQLDFDYGYLALAILSGNLAYDLWTFHPFRNLQSLMVILFNSVCLSGLTYAAVHYNNDEIDTGLLTYYAVFQLMLNLYAGIFTWPRYTSKTLSATTKITTKQKEELWEIHGNFYDLESFINKHPGGREAILLGRGRDCTALFESYHPFSNQHKIILQKYSSQTSSKTRHTSSGIAHNKRDEFYDVLKKRVAKHLRDNGIDPIKHRGATLSRCLYYVIIILCLFYTGYKYSKGNCLMYSAPFALFGWLVGALGHDGGHFSVSRIPIVNTWSTWGMSLLCNPIMWQSQHTYAHHSHTNNLEKDPDVHHFSIFLRYHKNMIYDKIYKNQENVFYVLFAYALVTFGECIRIPWIVYMTESMYGTVDIKGTITEKAFMILHWILYFLVIVVMPFWNARSSLEALASVVLHISLTGLLFAFFSQINHINEPSMESAISNNENGGLDDGDECIKKTSSKSTAAWKYHSWAAQQIETSNNFSHNSLFWHILSNGLNMQIEHHLFPGLNHCHLYLIAPVVRDTCKEYGVNYKHYETWNELFRATLDHLKKLACE